MKGVKHYTKDGKVHTGGSHKMPIRSSFERHIHLLVKNYFTLDLSAKVKRKVLMLTKRKSKDNNIMACT